MKLRSYSLFAVAGSLIASFALAQVQTPANTSSTAKPAAVEAPKTMDKKTMDAKAKEQTVTTKQVAQSNEKTTKHRHSAKTAPVKTDATASKEAAKEQPKVAKSAGATTAPATTK